VAVACSDRDVLASLGIITLTSLVFPAIGLPSETSVERIVLGGGSFSWASDPGLRFVVFTACGPTQLRRWMPVAGAHSCQGRSKIDPLPPVTASPARVVLDDSAGAGAQLLGDPAQRRNC
jgi:hypothetical protein